VTRAAVALLCAGSLVAGCGGDGRAGPPRHALPDLIDACRAGSQATVDDPAGDVRRHEFPGGRGSRGQRAEPATDLRQAAVGVAPGHVCIAARTSGGSPASLGLFLQPAGEPQARLAVSTLTPDGEEVLVVRKDAQRFRVRAQVVRRGAVTQVAVPRGELPGAQVDGDFDWQVETHQAVFAGAAPSADFTDCTEPSRSGGGEADAVISCPVR
jgi:hypothetical protein